MKILVDYDPIGGNVTISGLMFYTAPNLIVSEYKDNIQATSIQESDVVKLSNNGVSAKDLIKLREAGVI